MKQLPTYTEQFNKITEAYIKGEIEPNNTKFCFCGTLEGRRGDWYYKAHFGGNGTTVYSVGELVRMEAALFKQFPETVWDCVPFFSCSYTRIPDYEDKLFNGMVAALEVLKQIHIERGEIIDDAPQFQKRKLQTA